MKKKKTHKTDRDPPITIHKPWPFESVEEKFCLLRGPLRWLTVFLTIFVVCSRNLLDRLRLMTERFYRTFLVKITDCDVTLADVTKMEKIGFYFLRQKYILAEKAPEERQTTENHFSMRHVWARLWDFKNISVRPCGWIHSFFLRNDCSGMLFFSFSFQHPRCLICSLNSKGNLTRKHSNLEWREITVFVVQNLCKLKLWELSSHVRYWRHFSDSNSLLSDLSEKKNRKIWSIQKFKIYVRMTSGSDSSQTNPIKIYRK